MIAAGPTFHPHSPQTEAITAVFSLVLVLAAAIFLVVASVSVAGVIVIGIGAGRWIRDTRHEN